MVFTGDNLHARVDPAWRAPPGGGLAASAAGRVPTPDRPGGDGGPRDAEVQEPKDGKPTTRARPRASGSSGGADTPRPPKLPGNRTTGRAAAARTQPLASMADGHQLPPAAAAARPAKRPATPRTRGEHPQQHRSPEPRRHAQEAAPIRRPATTDTGVGRGATTAAPVRC